MKTAAEEEVYGVAMITADKDVECQLHLSYTETEATTLSLTDIDHVMNQRQRQIKGITSKT
jgi:hypothetical protein